MQIIEKILMIDGPSAEIVDSWGKSGDALEVMVGVRSELVFDLRTTESDEESGELLSVNPAEYEADSYYIAMDADYDQATIPKLLKTDGITLQTTENGRVRMALELPNTAVPALIDALNKAASISFHCEIGGLEAIPGNDDETVAVAGFAFQFELTVRNRVWLGGEVPPEVVGNPEYLTAAEVRALIAEATRPEQGPKGDPGLSAYEVAVAGGYQGTQSEWLESLKGADGEDGASAYEIAVAGGYDGTESEWLESLKGAAGLSAYEIALLQGYIGTADAWLASLKGEPGDGLHYDKSGDLAELDLYAGEPAGFIYAATETDSETKTSKLYLYKKNSDDFGDWCDPLVLTFYEREYKIESLDPVKFSAPDKSDYEYLTFNLSDFPNATVAAVTIDTNEGELTLPYGSALGVRKIVKTSDGKMLIYFGSQCPDYETGKIYLTQFLGVADSGGSPVYTGKMMYGYIPQSVLGSVYHIGQITPTMLADSRSKITEADAGTLGKTSLGTVPEGALVVVLLPTGNGLVAEKFDGLGGYVEFIENNVESGTGANGADYSYNGTPYQIYGEYVLAAAEISIRVIEEQ